jgi:hypothetical protein
VSANRGATTAGDDCGGEVAVARLKISDGEAQAFGAG